ncbi:hypothetical protein MBLNU230_g7714t1 [Neophaeotheca triangularis]
MPGKSNAADAIADTTVTYGYNECGNYETYNGIRAFYESAGCTAFPRQPQWVCWENPRNPDDKDGLPYWNMLMYFTGDECPVIGHTFQCDTVGRYCACFTGSRPLSYNVVDATTGVRNCDAPF